VTAAVSAVPAAVSAAAVSAAVVCGWFLAPAVTIVVFFLTSAWHFGLEEPRAAWGPRGLRRLCQLARGGLVVWIPLVCHRREVDTILGIVAPGGATAAVTAATSLLAACSWAMLAVAAAAWVLHLIVACSRTGWPRRVLLADAAVVASFAVLFAVASPLVGFLVYFCGWHSARGLRRLRIELGESWSELAGSLAPLTAGAVALMGVLTWLGLGGAGWHATLIRATFVGLSAVAVPHLLLHGFAPLFAASARRRSTQPMHTGSLA